MEEINSNSMETNKLLQFEWTESLLQVLIKKANARAMLVQRPLNISSKRYQQVQTILSKIFALETWRRRQHEHLICQLEKITESLDARLLSTLKEKNLLISENQALQKELTSTRSVVTSLEQRNASLTKANNDLKTQTESLINTVVSATNENKTLRERDTELRQKLEEAEARVAKLLTIKSERILQNSRYLPIGTTSVFDRSRRQLANTQVALPKSLTRHAHNIGEEDKKAEDSAPLTASGTSPFNQLPKVSHTCANQKVDSHIVLQGSGHEKNNESKVGLKRKQPSTNSCRPEAPKPKTRLIRPTLSKELSTFESRTPLRDRLRSRTKKRNS